MFKEEIDFLGTLEQRQTQIYDDACDAGVLMLNLNNNDVSQLRETIKDLLSLPGSEIVYRTDFPVKQRQYSLIVMHGDADYGRYDATCVEVIYVKDKSKEFFSFNSKHVYTDKNGKII